MHSNTPKVLSAATAERTYQEYLMRKTEMTFTKVQEAAIKLMQQDLKYIYIQL